MKISRDTAQDRPIHGPITGCPSVDGSDHLDWPYRPEEPRDALASPPVCPFVPQWGNFVEAWNSNDFGRSFLTTISVSLLLVAITLLTAIPAGYALARYRYGWLTALDVAMLMIRLLPEVLFMLPLYVLYQRMDVRHPDRHSLSLPDHQLTL